MQVVLLKSRWKARYGNKHLFMGLTNNSHLIVTASLKTIDGANWQLVRRDWLEKKAMYYLTSVPVKLLPGVLSK